MASVTIFLCTQSALAAEPAPAGQGVEEEGQSLPGIDGDIVVTAQKRSERLVDVPVSITAIPQASLQVAGMTSLEVVTKLAPGVLIDGPGYQLTPTIRGIGATALGAGIQADVAIYIDGVYQADQSSSAFDLGDVADIQVLKGPQGTLFGRNATGGAILVTTRDPTLGTSEADINLEYGRFGDVRANGYVNLPLNDAVSVSASGGYHYSGGWIRDLRSGVIVNESRSYNGRVKLLLQPTDQFKLIITGWASRVDDPTGTYSASLDGNSIGKLFPGGGPIASTRGRTSSSIGIFVADSAEVSVRAELDVGFGKLSSITAYHRDRSRVGSDLDLSYTPVADADLRQRNNAFSQEINLSSKPGGRLTYTIGSYYQHQDTGYPAFYVGGAPIFNSSVRTDAIAGYIDGSYKLGRLSLLGGLRYSHETLNFGIGPGNDPYTVRDKATYNSWSPRLGLSYALADRTNVYFTYSRGFKSGQFNLGSFTERGVRPETVDAFELGIKTADGPVTLSAAGYYYDFKDIQLTAYAQGGSTVAQLFNAAKARIYGSEIEATAKLDPSLDVRLGGAWTHARYAEFPGAPFFTPTPDLSGNIASSGDASGNPMIRAPEFTLSGALNHRVDIGDGRLTTSISPFWSSKIYYSFDKRLVQPSYFTIDGRATYSFENGVSIYLYGRNLTDKIYTTYQQESSLRDGIVFAQPRTFGIGILYKK